MDATDLVRRGTSVTLCKRKRQERTQELCENYGGLEVESDPSVSDRVRRVVACVRRVCESDKVSGSRRWRVVPRKVARTGFE